MSSSKRLIPSQAKQARSHGPVDPAEQGHSSRSALRAALLAKCLVLRSESREDFDALLADFVERLHPTDGVELCMVEEMLSTVWRLRRARAIETRIKEDSISTRPPDPRDPACLIDAVAIRAAKSNLDSIRRYEKRLHTVFQCAHANLILMRSLQKLQPPENSKFTTRTHNRPPTRTNQNHLQPMTHEPISPKKTVPVSTRPAFRPSGLLQQPPGVPPERRCG